MSSFSTGDVHAGATDNVGGVGGGPAPVPGAVPPMDAARAGVPGMNIVVIDSDATARTHLVTRLGGTVSQFASIDELSPYLNGEPVVIVLGPNCSSDGTIGTIERLLHGHPEVGAILVAEELTTALLQQALRSGVKDVVAAPGDDAQLHEAVNRVAQGLASAPTAPPAVEPLFDDDGEIGHVITVFSTKGGAGKSMIATNLGVALAKRSEKPVCLVDADLQFGDIAVMLKLSPQHTIVDAVSSIDRLDASLLQNLLVVHEASGLLILPAPLEPAFADQIGSTEMVQIVEVLRRFCSYVVVDTPAYFNDVVLGMIEISDDVLLVAGMDIPNIKNVKIGLQTLRLLNTPMEKLRLVLNRANSKVKLDVTEVERTLQVSADCLIPSDVIVPQSVNRGVPVILSAPRSGVAKSIEEMADLFAPTSGKKKK
jgi:pilus assembly protein CpaE